MTHIHEIFRNTMAAKDHNHLFLLNQISIAMEITAMDPITSG